MIKQMSEEFYKKLYSLPPNAVDLNEFANIILNKFIDELLKNKQAIAWNEGFDAVVFLDKTVDEKRSLLAIKEEFLGQKGDIGDSTLS